MTNNEARGEQTSLNQSIDFILASTSPRRADLLRRAGYRFEIVAPAVEERIGKQETAADLVLRLATEKAKRVARDYPQHIIVAADTVVYQAPRIFGKPKDADEALAMLMQLSGSWHEVFTGFAVCTPTRCMQKVVTTRVKMVAAPAKWLIDYIATGEPFDKAGGYGIQGAGCVLIETIVGDFFNVMGLPMSALAAVLAELTIVPFKID